MTRNEFVTFMNSIDYVVPIDVQKALARHVLIEGNYDDKSIERDLNRIERKGYLDFPYANYAHETEPYVEFVTGMLKLLLLIPENIRNEGKENA